MTPEGYEDELVCIIDDDADVRASLEMLLRSADYRARAFAGPEEFLRSRVGDDAACLILDVNLVDANGLDFQQKLIAQNNPVSVILISGMGDVPMTVRGMKAGAVTFLTKPFEEDAMLAAIEEALARHRTQRKAMTEVSSIQDRYATLTPRERDLFELVTAGLMNKQIAGQLALSEITVKIHRGNMVRKMQADSVADLVRMADLLQIRANVSRYNKRRTGGSDG